MRLTWVGHATVVIDVGGVRLLTDPLLRRHAGTLRRIGASPSPEVWRNPDAVLVSHLHYDHAELASLRLVPGAPILTGPANARWLRRRVRAELFEPGSGGWVRVGPDVEVRLVRADHRHRPMPHRPNDAHGHLIRTAEQVVWFAGDTSLYPEMAKLSELAGRPIDVALVPIAGWGRGLSGGHLDPSQAAEACLLVQPGAALPIHHGTLHPRGYQRLSSLDWMHRPLAAFREELAARAPDVRLLEVGLGGSVEV